MRKSALRHPLAILRKIIGYDQDRMAALIGCSPSAVKSIEVCRLKLSPALAKKIENETGVSAQWLLEGDVTSPIISSCGDDYTIQFFREAQAGLKYDSPHIQNSLRTSSAYGSAFALLELVRVYKATISHRNRNVIFWEILESNKSLIKRHRLEKAVWEREPKKSQSKFEENLTALLLKEFGAKPFRSQRISKDQRHRMEARIKEAEESGSREASAK